MNKQLIAIALVVCGIASTAWPFPSPMERSVSPLVLFAAK